jgi:2,3-dihydroxybenzoate decarboxylase
MGDSYIRIATEEAWATPELLEGYKRILADGSDDDPGFRSLWGFYSANAGERATAIIRRLPDMGEIRLQDMADTGIARQILLLTSPGVQVFGRDEAVGLARDSNATNSFATRFMPS